MVKKRVRKSASERRDEIMASAYRILISKGYSEVSLRGIASDLDVRLSTIQYHFSSREKLVESMIKLKIDHYNRAYENIDLIGYEDDGSRMSFIIKYLVDDCSNRETCVFFTQLWAMSFIMEDLKPLLKRMYDVHIEWLSNNIRLFDESLSQAESVNKAMAISSMIEGSIVHFGYQVRPEKETEQFKNYLYNKILTFMNIKNGAV